MKDSILKEAYGLVTGPRNALYDHPADDYQRTVDIFYALTGIKLTPEEGILFMLSVKLSRDRYARETNKLIEARRDSIVDIAGYTECYWQTLERNSNENQSKNHRRNPR